MAATNSFIDPTQVAREGLMQLDNELVMANLVYRDYEEEMMDKGGGSITIRRPPKYTVRDGAVASAQNTNFGSVVVSIDKYKGVDFEFSTRDLTLRIEDFSERHIKPAMRALANQIDMDLLDLALKSPNWVGTPGNTFGGFDDVSRVAQRMMEQAVPAPINGILSPADHFGLLNNFTGLYIQDTAKTALTRAKLPMVAGIDLYASQNVRPLTVGTRAASGATLINGASQTSTYASVATTMTQTLNVDGLTSGHTVKAGEVFSIANVYAVNPVTGETLDYLAQFTVTTDATANGSGQIALSIYPAIITAAPYKTASAAPADNAAVTWLGTASTIYRQNIFFNKMAFALVTRPLVIAPGSVGAKRETFKGISARVTPVYDGVNDVSLWRFDMIYGVKAIYPELSCRASG